MIGGGGGVCTGDSRVECSVWRFGFPIFWLDNGICGIISVNR